MTPKPISFTCYQTIDKSAVDICHEIADMSRWPDFEGYGVMPGIANARYETRTADMVGSVIAVENRDGSTHAEEILCWDVGTRVTMKLFRFQPPVSRLATHFIEDWTFKESVGSTEISRHLDLYPVSRFTRPFLWLISRLLKGAIQSHLKQMANDSNG